MQPTVFRLLAGRIVQAFLTWPDRRGWRDTALLAAAYALIALPVGLGGGIFALGWTAMPALQALFFTLIAVVTPSLFEELLFRIMFIPHKTEPVSAEKRWAWAGFALILFVLWHPLNAGLLHPWEQALFYDPVFLFLAGLLGLVCTLAYVRTGSIWPPVLLHWFAVVAWKLGLGGRIFLFEA